MDLFKKNSIHILKGQKKKKKKNKIVTIWNNAISSNAVDEK